MSSVFLPPPGGPYGRSSDDVNSNGLPRSGRIQLPRLLPEGADKLVSDDVNSDGLLRPGRPRPQRPLPEGADKLSSDDDENSNGLPRPNAAMDALVREILWGHRRRTRP
jgi:hypothetical protein